MTALGFGGLGQQSPDIGSPSTGRRGERPVGHVHPHQQHPARVRPPLLATATCASRPDARLGPPRSWVTAS